MALTQQQRRANIERALARVRSSTGGVTGYARGGAKVKGYVNVTYTDPSTGKIVTRSVSPEDRDKILEEAKRQREENERIAREEAQAKVEQARAEAEKQQITIIKSLFQRQEEQRRAKGIAPQEIPQVSRGEKGEIIIEGEKRKKVFVTGGGNGRNPKRGHN